MATKADVVAACPAVRGSERAAPKQSRRIHRDTDCGRSGEAMLLIADLRCGYRVRCCDTVKRFGRCHRLPGGPVSVRGFAGEYLDLPAYGSSDLCDGLPHNAENEK